MIKIRWDINQNTCENNTVAKFFRGDGLYDNFTRMSFCGDMLYDNFQLHVIPRLCTPKGLLVPRDDSGVVCIRFTESV